MKFNAARYYGLPSAKNSAYVIIIVNNHSCHYYLKLITEVYIYYMKSIIM